MASSNDSLDTLPPSAKLALLHAQAASSTVEEDPFVPSPDDPVVTDNYAYEPLIAGDYPTPIGKPVAASQKKEPAVPTKKNLDLSSESAFPSLSASPRTPVATSGWSSAASARVKSPQQGSVSPRPMAPPASGNANKKSVSSITSVLKLPAHQQIANMASKPLGFKSNADVIQQVISKTGTNIIASTNRSGTTTFLIQGAPNDVNRAKRELAAGLVVKRTVEIAVPASTRRFIIGAKGATLKQIEAKSNTRINFPRKEEEDSSFNEENPDELIDVTIVGDTTGIAIAKEEIEKIIGDKIAKSSIKVEGLDSKYYLFLCGAENNNIKKIEDEFDVKINMPALIVDGTTNSDTVITISGDKEKIQQAKQALEAIYSDIEKNSRTIAISIPKRQHKYLYGKNGEILKEIWEEAGCTVELPPAEDSSENVTIRGLDADLVKGLTVVMEKARAVHVSVLDLTENYKSVGDKATALKHAQSALKYLLHRKSIKKIEREHNVQVGVPQPEELKKAVSLEFVSKVEKDAALAQLALSNIIRELPPQAFGSVDVEVYLHQHLATHHSAVIERIQSAHDVTVIFPDEKEASKSVLIVYGGKGDAKDAISAAAAEIAKIAADSSDYITKSISIPAELHDALRGPRGTTLNAIVGESEAVVRFGPADQVEIRGFTQQVSKVVAKLQKAQEAVQQEGYNKSYTEEFFIPSNFSAHIIGKAGIHINKLKEDFGIKVDIGENSEEKTSGKKKNTATSVKVVIQGPKLNTEAAKERILSQVSSLADQVTLSLKVPREFHRLLIGPSGRYVKKLEDKYNVFIKFPRSGGSNRGDESPSTPTNPDEVTVRGGKKDAQAAKEELMELYEYEKEEQAQRKEREQKHKEYQEKRAAEDKRRAEERAAREARDAAKEAAREAKKQQQQQQQQANKKE
ncbi:hypothetical protein EDC96DRAFT_483484 [Choanephora cucurbitarum]|nr:hypothetical protein EDC96DRAFT_483484 [Choanephora cucurbitarum]